MSKTNKIKKAWREGGGLLVLKRIINYFYNKTFPKPIRGFLDIVINEKAVPYPQKGEWIVFDPIRLEKRRMLPVLTENVGNTRQATQEHQRKMMNLYSKENFAEIRRGDVVIEVGAYIGGFTIPASKKANKVIAIDPNAAISKSLEFNTQNKENIEVVPKAAWKEKAQLEINQSLYPNDNSILKPDENDIGKSFEVEANSVPNICREKDIEKIDFLKLEAEGVEPEILKATLEDRITIRNIVVDTTPERDGEPTTEAVKSLLRKNNYELKYSEEYERDGRIVYSKKVSEDG